MRPPANAPCRLFITRLLLCLLAVAHLCVGTVWAASLSHAVSGDEHAHLADGDHGHSHDDEHGELADASHDATHGHDPSDHSHDKPSVPPLHLTRAPACAAPLNARDGRNDYPPPCSLPERPPKRLSTT